MIAFLVIASSEIVRAINESMANIVLLLLVSVCFLLLIGSFFKEDEGVFLKEEPMRTAGMVIMFVGVIVIFLHAFGWLRPVWDWLVAHWQTNFVATVVLLIFIAIFMGYIIRGGEQKKPSSPKKEE